MPFRESILEIAPPWLLGRIAQGIQYGCGLVIDALGEWAMEGVKARMPGVGTPDALPLIGRDRLIDRGPSETDANYALRLSRAFDTWATAGGAPTLLRALAVWFSPLTTTPIRLVSNSAVWHEIDLGTLIVTKTVVGTNWGWDAFTTRWFRGWAILDSSAAPWTPDLWGAGNWGDGGTWGSNATVAQVAQIRGIVEKWKPAHVFVPNIIVTFSATLFEVADTSPPNPSGTSDTALWRLGYNAIFWKGTK
jgi:hypothetical protein